MHSPALVFSLVAVSALSPSLVLSTPLPGHSDSTTSVDRHRMGGPAVPRGLGFLNEVFSRAEHQETPPSSIPSSKPKVANILGYSLGGRAFWKRDPNDTGRTGGGSQDALTTKSDPKMSPRESKDDPDDDADASESTNLMKRFNDDQTTGGNAHSGTAGAVDGGSVDSGDNGGMPVLLNMESNNAGGGGGSTTGCVAGGKGATGGNASSGDSGSARGGEVSGSGGMVNMYSNNAGTAGESSSGCAEAGNSAGAGVNSQGKETTPTS